MRKLARNINIGFRVTEQERTLIAERMKDAGISSVRAFLLKMALNGYIIRLDMTEVREMIRLLRSVSNNVNQIAKRVNEGGNIYAVDISDVQLRLGEVWERLEKLLKALSKI